MAKDYHEIARAVIEHVGGKENIRSVTHCITRLRFVLKNEDLAQTDQIKKVKGVIDVVRGNGQYQIVIGTDVSDAYDAAVALLGDGFAGGEVAADPGQDDLGGRPRGFDAFAEIVTSVFMPVLGPMSAAGLLKGLLAILTNYELLPTDSGTYIVLYAAADAFFAFLPFALAYTAAERFKTNKFLALAVVAPLMYSSITAAYAEEAQLFFLGIPITLMNYTSAVIPPILIVWLLSKLEPVVNKVTPRPLRFFLAPFVCLVVLVPLLLLAVGPMSMFVGNALSAAILSIYNVAPQVAAAIFAFLWPILIIFGAHWAFNPIVINNIATLGYDWLSPLTWGCNFAMAGACLGVFLKTKDQGLREIAGPNFITAFIAGITEPAIYGVNLKFRRPFFIACGTAAIGGIVMATVGFQRSMLMGVSLLTLPAWSLQPNGWAVLVTAAIGFFGACILTYLFGFHDGMIPEDERTVE